MRLHRGAVGRIETRMKYVSVWAAALLLTGCGWVDSADKNVAVPDVASGLTASESVRRLPESQREAAKLRQGSLKDLVFAPGSDEAPQRNLYLWDAALDVLARFPLKVVDSKNGLIVTEPVQVTGNETQQITVRVDGGRLTPRLLTVSISKQVSGGIVPAAPEVAAKIKAQIIARAQQLRAQRQGE